MHQSSTDLLIQKMLSSGEISASEVYSAGIDVNEFGRLGRTPLMAAASEGLIEAVDTLVNASASANAVGKYGMTALHEACANGHVRTALRLLELGAEVDAETEDGVTPLMCAAAWGHVEIGKLLLSYGAKRQDRDRMGASATDIAGEKGEQAFVDFLNSLEED